MRRIVIVYFDAGSGHRSAAKGLERALLSARPDWRVRMVNVEEAFAPNKQFHRIVKAGIDYFNWKLKREKVFDLKGLINLSLMFHDLLSSRGIREISNFWKDDPPDAVVSVTPMYNPALYRSVRLVNPHAVCITIPVDFEEAKPRYWFTPKVEQHYLVATDRLEEQARKAKIPDSFIHRIPGMPIDPEFYELPSVDTARELERLGLDPALPTGVASFGGQGSVLLGEIARRLAQSDLKLNMIFLCGRHAEVYEEVSKLETPYRKLVLGYSKQTPIYYHRLADFVIGKPGSMTITEALVTRLPLIVIKSRGMWPVQRANEEWVEKRGVGLIVDRMDTLEQAVTETIASRRYRQNAEREFHRGVFGAADLIWLLAEQPDIRPHSRPMFVAETIAG
jgi:glycosyl transferase family 28